MAIGFIFKASVLIAWIKSIRHCKARKSYLKRVDKAFTSAENFQAEKLKIATQTYEFVMLVFYNSGFVSMFRLTNVSIP